MSDPLPPLRDVVAAHGLGAKKSFGQHFLFDLNLTAKIARLAGDIADTTVFEVGPGPGGLTRALLAEGAKRVIAIEMDGRFMPVLGEIEHAWPGRLEFIEADALDIDETRLAPAGDRAIVSNLPYNVGTPLLIKWLRAEPPWWRIAVLMFQREVADRIVAAPGSKAYGRLAVLTQSRCEARMALKAPARAFTPPPKVESAVIVLRPLPPEMRFGDLQALETVTESAFGQRRKMLRSSLSAAAAKAGVTADALLDAAGIDPTARAETIGIAGFQRLAACWRAARDKA